MERIVLAMSLLLRCWATKCGEELEIYPYDEEPSWGTSYTGWEDCKNSEQSPINIFTRRVTEDEEEVEGFKFVWNNAIETVEFSNSGHSAKAASAKADESWGTFPIGEGSQSVEFAISQVHFHTPSEHQVDGVNAVSEMHAVSKGGANGEKTAVLSLMFDLGEDDNECLEQLLKVVPKAGCTEEITGDLFKLECLSSHFQGDYYNYQGSFTTPPCTEGVDWYVFKKRLTLSETQLNTLRDRFPHGNNRAVQKVNDRKITLKKVKPAEFEDGAMKLPFAVVTAATTLWQLLG